MDGEYISSDIKIGNTPIVRLNRLEAKYKLNFMRILEYQTPWVHLKAEFQMH